jgi:hypothetical protein
MTIYTVHLPPEADKPESVADKAVFVKEGFATAGFVFTGFWLLAQRLWLHALGYFLLLGLAIAAFWWLGLPRLAFGGVTALLALLVGLEGHEWMRRRFGRKGWAQAGTVSGPSLDECERRFFQDWLAGRPAPPPRPVATTPASPAPAGVLGVFPEARFPQAPGRT